jgi:hypothetical protein
LAEIKPDLTDLPSFHVVIRGVPPN